MARHVSQGVDFQRLFEHSPSLFMVLTPDFRVLAVTNEHLKATLKTREEVLGKDLFEVFPENPDEEDAISEKSLRASLTRTVVEKAADAMPVFRYDIKVPEARGAGYVERYWVTINRPIFDDQGEVLYILNQSEDVTEMVMLQAEKERGERENRELLARTMPMERELWRRSQELEQANHELLEAAQAQNQFLSRMSHELRTPLTAVMGFTELLEMTHLDEHQAEYVRTVGKAGDHLLVMLNDILDISRIEAGSLPLSLETVAVDFVLGEVMEMIAPVAASYEVQLADAPAGLLSVKADHQRLKQVLLNLLTNAIKYNHPSGTVNIEVAEEEEWVRIGVRDTGPGLRQEQIERLFTPFDRLGAEGGPVAGSGIGLALSRNLAVAMGGRLEVESAEGKGSAFSVVLPRAETLAPEVIVEKAPAARERAYSESRKVLYVEDTVANVHLVEEILAYRPSIILLSAGTGSLALDLARDHDLDMVLLDLHLPDIQGDEVLVRLRADPKTADVPIVMLSADATRPSIEKLLAVGADAYLTKPVSVQRLLEVVDRHLGQESKTE